MRDWCLRAVAACLIIASCPGVLLTIHCSINGEGADMALSEPRQLSLGVSLKDDATFTNFHAPAGGANAQMVAAVRAQLQVGGERFIYLWGGSGVGLTHLLQASCHLAEAQQLRVQYLPLKELVGFAPEALLDRLDQLDLVCLDGLDAVAGKRDWEQALFNLYNALREGEGRLLVAAETNPRELAL